MPKMIETSERDEIAKRRTVMILEVLSGRMPVSDAIAQAKISRPLYYQLETKALEAMLSALTPSDRSRPGPAPRPDKQLAVALEKIEKLEVDKRRLERLLSMTKRVLQGPLKGSAGRKKKRSSKPSSPSSSAKRTSKTTCSTPTASGEVAPSNGSEN